MNGRNASIPCPRLCAHRRRQMRMVLASSVMVAFCTALAPPAAAEPAGTCPPALQPHPGDRVDHPEAILLDSVYPGRNSPGWRSPPVRRGSGSRSYAAPLRSPATPRLCGRRTRGGVEPGRPVAAAGQVVHWRGDTWLGGELAQGTFQAAVAALRACQSTNPTASPRWSSTRPTGSPRPSAARWSCTSTCSPMR